MASSSVKKSSPTQPSAALLTIGNELLTGRTLNTNTTFLGGELTRLGFRVFQQQACPDNNADIHQALGRLASSQLLILTGGLGPTPDDLTREALAAYFGVPLKFSKSQFQAMQAIYRKLGKILPLLSRQEAYYPANAQPLINRFGIALGFWIQNHEQLMIVLPGVPTELQKMFLHDVKPLLLKKFHGLQADKTLSIHTVGISEPRIIEKLKRDFFAMPFQFGIYPSEGETQICIRSPSQKMIQTLRKKIQQRIGQYIYSWKDETLAELIGQLLVKQKKTLSVAESCTGGSLAFSWTRHAGASRYFRGGVVVYDASAKSGIGVSKTVIKKHGQVSAAVAEELAKSARAFFNTDYGIGVTGIAGPAGGSAQKQVGLVYISIFSSARKRVTEKFLFWGNRDQIQRKAVIKAQELLWRILIA